MTLLQDDDTVYAYLGGITKSKDADGFLRVKGIASDDTLDLDEQRCDPDWLKTAMSEWFKTGNIREMHQLSAIGKATKMTQAGTAFEIETKIIDKSASEKFENDIYTGFSIGIKGARVDLSDAARKRAAKGIINGGRIIEVSGVDRPANPNALAEVMKSASPDVARVDLVLLDSTTLFKADEVTADDQPACDTCNGFGQVMMSDGGQMGVCPACSGSGKGPDVTLRPSDAGGDKDNGQIDDGKAGDPDCTTCKGKGTIKDGNMDCPDCVQKKADYLTDYFGWTDADKAEWTPFQKSLYPDSVKKDYSDKERKQMSSNGQALPGGGFPIKTVQDLKNAIQAIGRAKDPAAAKAHIMQRAKALGQEALIPDDWKTDKTAVVELVKALSGFVTAKAADGDTWTHDPAAIKQVTDGISNLLIAEIKEQMDGEDERNDISQLSDALSTVLSWQMGEYFAGETPSPFTSGDGMSFVGLGVSADLIKAAGADDASDADKDALKADVLKALGLEDVSATKTLAEGTAKTVEDTVRRLETVEKFSAPKGIALRAQEFQRGRFAQAEELEMKAAEYEGLSAQWTDPETKKLYAEGAVKMRDQATEIRKALEGDAN